jgi:aminotransferase EvaB
MSHEAIRIPMNDLSRGLAVDRQEIDDAVKTVLDSGWLVLGAAVSAFETAFGGFTGVSECVGVASGTDALEIALRAVDVGPGDRVCTAANAGFYATTACLRIGAEPMYVDIDPETHALSPHAVSAALAHSPSAVVLTHLYGGMRDAAAIADICRRAGVPLIEDCAQAAGAHTEQGVHAGAVGDLGCFSFYPTKNLGGIGDGGAITTRSAELADRCRALRQYGWGSRYVVDTAGANSRLDEIQAAVLLQRLPLLADRNNRRRVIAATYQSAVEQNPFLERILFWSGPTHVAHLAVIVSDHRSLMMRSLAQHGIATDIHYPVTDDRQPLWGPDPSFHTPGGLHVTHAAAERILSVPCFPELSDEELMIVGEAIASFDPEQVP